MFVVLFFTKVLERRHTDQFWSVNQGTTLFGGSLDVKLSSVDISSLKMKKNLISFSGLIKRSSVVSSNESCKKFV